MHFMPCRKVQLSWFHIVSLMCAVQEGLFSGWMWGDNRCKARWCVFLPRGAISRHFSNAIGSSNDRQSFATVISTICVLHLRRGPILGTPELSACLPAMRGLRFLKSYGSRWLQCNYGTRSLHMCRRTLRPCYSIRFPMPALPPWSVPGPPPPH